MSPKAGSIETLGNDALDEYDPKKLQEELGTCEICGGMANGWKFEGINAHPTCLAREVVRLRTLLAKQDLAKTGETC